MQVKLRITRLYRTGSKKRGLVSMNLSIHRSRNEREFRRMFHRSADHRLAEDINDQITHIVRSKDQLRCAKKCEETPRLILMHHLRTRVGLRTLDVII